MKFIVEVNRKYLVAVEAETLCGAEHVILDRYADEINTYHVISGAMAYDREGMKTDYFMTALESCETISLAELDGKVKAIAESCEKIDELRDYKKQLERKLEEIEVEIERLQTEYTETKIKTFNLENKIAKIINGIGDMKAEIGA